MNRDIVKQTKQLWDAKDINEKFGGAFAADKRTFKMGIDRRFTQAMAERFRGRNERIDERF